MPGTTIVIRSDGHYKQQLQEHLGRVKKLRPSFDRFKDIVKFAKTLTAEEIEQGSFELQCSRDRCSLEDLYQEAMKQLSSLHQAMIENHLLGEEQVFESLYFPSFLYLPSEPHQVKRVADVMRDRMLQILNEAFEGKGDRLRRPGEENLCPIRAKPIGSALEELLTLLHEST